MFASFSAPIYDYNYKKHNTVGKHLFFLFKVYYFIINFKIKGGTSSPPPPPGGAVAAAKGEEIFKVKYSPSYSAKYFDVENLPPVNVFQ